MHDDARNEIHDNKNYDTHDDICRNMHDNMNKNTHGKANDL